MINEDKNAGVPVVEQRKQPAFSYYAAIVTAVMTGLTLGIAVGTPPLSGPFCKTGCFKYPFLDIGSRFPRDYLWMYPAIIATAWYLVLMVCIGNHARKEHRIYGQCGLAFAILSAGILIVDYFLQISVIQPGVVLGEPDGISLLSQFNPHGLFIALEEIGFILMSASFLCVAPLFSMNAVERAIRLIFVLSFSATIVSFLLFTLFLGVHREYYFEITAITVNWLALIVTSILLSVVFRKEIPR